ncbi:TPA: hypothetical protein N0F65_000119 [Lagenidium giganteum]|uniref:FYVE-type domain-containing protein n=1 Tax=Lagenidium giganteum TaxID=4803 RepID=A0AAV2YU26_9STRA|nr:TPA: hypothetical protein N0F65_000119 [Lagenidium giganteum]
MGGMAAKEGKLPLPDDFFDVPELNTKERHYLINLAKRACKEVVYYSRRSGGPINWVHLSSEDGVEVFQGIDESGRDAKASMTYLRGCTKICATIDEIADFFRLDTPSKLTGFAQTVGKDLLDQKTLYNLAMPTEENPRHYVGVKWTAVESPSKLARNRDFCYLECHDEFIDTSGKKRGWVRSLHSIRLPCCPRLNKSHGLVRGSMYRSGFIFIESEKKGWVDAIHTLHLDIKGSAPNWLKILVMKRRIKNIAEVNKYFQLRRLGEGKLLGDLELPAKEGVQRCQSCDTKFGLFHRKWRCRKCGKVVCTSCGHHFLLDYAGVGPRKVRICNGCSESVTQGTAVDTEDQGLVRGTPKKCEETVPLYDDVMHENGRAARKLQEHEYYLKNEDARGIADMMAAKRMQQEFEHQLKLSSSRPFQNRASNSGYGRNEAEYDEHDDDEELGLPRSRSEQQRFNMEQQWRHNQFAPSGNESTHSSRTRLPSWNHRDRDYPSSRPAESSRLHGVDYDNASQRLSGQRRGSVDSIRMSLDWGADYVVTLDPTAPESERFSNGSYQSAESANTPGRRLDHGRGCDGERERYGQYAAAGAARRRLQSEMSEYSQYHGSNRYDDFTRWQPSPLGQFDSHSMTDYGRYDRAYYGGSHQRRNSFNDLEPHVFDHFGRLTQPPFSALNSRPRSDMRRRSTTDRDHLAHFMALSAMQLYNQEFGADLLVPEETRQAALQKMVAMYAEEIDRKNRASAMRHSARKRSVGEPGPGMMLDPYAAPSRLPLSPRRSPQHHFPQTVAMDSPMHYR